MKNILFSIPKKATSVSFSWWPFFVLGVVLCVALGIRVYNWVQGPAVPPAVGWVGGETDKTDNERIETDSDGSEGSEGEVMKLGSSEVGSGTSEEKDPDDRKDPEDSVEEDGDLEVSLPEAINLAVPFVSQAPLGIWDDFTGETCEEASFLMVRAYYNGVLEGAIDPASADTDFRAMVALQEEMGLGTSISTAQFLSFAEAYNGAQGRVIENPSVNDLRALLAQGHPVIIPAFGRVLENPFFTGEGPLYHMLVLRGYTPTTFITNDPGTRHGENYQYAVDTFMRSIGDWDGDSPDGGARVIVLEP